MMPEANATLPRIEDFRADLTAEQILAARAANARSIAMLAYLQGVPAFLHMRQLTEIIQARQYAAPQEPPLGGWFLVRQLSDATTANVMPNVDTLYGASFLLLDRQGPVVLTVPPIPDRYYSIALHDAYFNNFAVVSPRTDGNAGGNYLIVPPGWTGQAPAGIKATFVAPTPAINLYQRIFMRNVSEYDELHRVQDAIRLAPLDQWGRPDAAFPPVDIAPFEVQGMRTTRDPLQFFAYTNFYTALNPPPAEDAGLAALFKTAGVGPGSELPQDPALRDAILRGAADAQAMISARISAGPFRAGWRVPDPNAGRSGPFLLLRAVTQIFQIGTFVPEEATYFFCLRDHRDELLSGDSCYTLTFAGGQIPPLHPHGFWSVTMYNQAGFLVDNPIHRFAIRPDSPGLTYNADGSLTLYIQASEPAGVPQANWLPAAQGVFFVGLRTYLPQQSILDGTWFPPMLQRADT
jgi:hypothetical protein